MAEIHSIPLGDIWISKLNVRLHDKKAEIEDLAVSIKKHDLLQPVVLKGKMDNPPYELVIGQRRFHACKLLYEQQGEKYEKIEAIFLKKEIEDIDVKILSLSENIHRVELNYADKAKALNDLYNHFGNSIKKVSEELGIPESTIREYIQIEEQATTQMKELWKRKEVNKADIKRAIKAAQGDAKKAERLLEEFSASKLTKYEKENAVEFGRKNPRASVDDIIKEVQTPRKGETIVLSLHRALQDALKKAKKFLYLEEAEIAIIALEDWLKRNGFMT